MQKVEKTETIKKLMYFYDSDPQTRMHKIHR